jgi:murein endopeptidase
MSGDWCQAAQSPRGLQWFTTKPLGFSVEPQNRGRRLDGGGAATQGGLTAQVWWSYYPGRRFEKLQRRGHMT